MRNTERKLVLYSAALGLGGLFLVCLAQGYAFSYLVGAALLVGGVLVVHVVLCAQCRQADEFLFPIAVLLTGLGLVLVFRLNPGQGLTQYKWVVVGLAALVATVGVVRDVEQLGRYKYLIVCGGLGLLLLTFVPGLGKEVNGAQLWVQVGGYRFQPSEVAKICLVLFLAAYLAERGTLLVASTGRLAGLRVPSMRYLGPFLLMWGLSLSLLVVQKDLGAALLFFGLFMAMTYLASGQVAYVACGGALFLAGAYGCYTQFHHVQVRIQTWLNPWPQIDGPGYQIIQSLFALNAGGVFGRGLGFGHAHLIPAVTTDFPFAAIIEELGLLGGGAILLLYSLFVARAMHIATRSSEPFTSLLAAGLGSIMALQTLIIVAGVCKLIPLTGITLPFISYGGSSIVTNFVLVGLLLRASE